MRRYKKKDLFEKAKEAIKENNLFFITDIIAFLPCDKATFYRQFPQECDECNELKEMLDNNKVRTKSSIRAKLYKSQKASELLALYRLIATPEEHRLLNQQYIENNIKSERPIRLDISIPDEDDEGGEEDSEHDSE